MSTLAIRLVDRYILKQLLDFFLLGVVVFTLIAFFSDTLLKFIQEIQKYGIPFSTLLTMIGLQLPRSIALVLPPSAFLAVLMVFNNLNNQFEIIAMRTNGISLWRLTLPALILGIFAAGMTYVLNDYVVPWCNTKTEQLKDEVMRSGNLPSGGSSFMYRTFDEKHNLVQMIYVSRYSGRKLGDSTIIDLSKPNTMQVVQARSGRWDPRQGWEFHNANTYLVGRDSTQSVAGHADRFWAAELIKDQKSIQKDLEKARAKQDNLSVDTDQQSFAQLWQVLKNREATQGKSKLKRSHYLEMWEKLTWPLGCLALVLCAVPLAMSPPRAGSNRGFVFAVVILFLFYMLYSIFQNLGQSLYPSFGGLLSIQGWLAIVSWLPMVVLFLIGFLLMQRKSRIL